MRRSALKKALVILMTFVLVFSSNSTVLTPVIAYAVEAAAEQDASTSEVGTQDDSQAVEDETQAQSSVTEGESQDTDAVSDADAAAPSDTKASADAPSSSTSQSAGSNSESARTAEVAEDDETAEGEAADESSAADLASDDELNAVADENDSEVSVQADDVSTMGEISVNKYWYDNHDSNRPYANETATTTDTLGVMHLYFRLQGEGDTWTELTDATKEMVGYEASEALPTISVTNSGTNLSTFSATVPLLVQVNGQDVIVDWKLDETDAANDVVTFGSDDTAITYQRTISDDNKTIKNVMVDDFSFKVEDLDGGNNQAHLKSSYQLMRKDGDKWVVVKTIEAGASSDEWVWTQETDGADVATNVFDLTFKNLPKYDENNNSLVYSLVCTNEVPDTSTFDASKAGTLADWYAPTNENSEVANYGTETDRTYVGGTLQLLRTNTYKMTIHKAWLDNNNAYSTRPTEDENRSYQLYLWRYVANGSNKYSDASQVVDANGRAIGANLPSATGLAGALFQDGDVEFSYTYKSATDKDYLPKYDAEGYEYVYLARETKPNGDGYEQVFGEVAEDGTVNDTLPDDVTREAADKSIYAGGTISNRLTGTKSVEGSKSWVAAAHQTYLSHYSVTMTLQQRAKAADGEVENEWVDTGTTQQLSGFSAEVTTQALSASMPQYDSLGRELEYRWVEGTIADSDGALDISSQTDADGSYTGDKGKVYFITSHNVNDANGDEGEDMRDRQNVDWYASETVESEDGSLSVTNKLEGWIDYKVVKEWYGQTDEATGTQSLEAPAEGTTLKLTLYRNGSVFETYTMNSGNAVEGAPGTWAYIFKNLPKYDANGNTYDYYVMEEIPDGYYPSYSFDDATRTMTIENHPGVEGQTISVAKEWLDDSNTAYRPTVSFHVDGTYKEETTTSDGVTHAAGDAFSYDGTLSAGNNWWQLVGATGVDLDTVTVYETKLSYASTDYAVTYADETSHTGGTVSTGDDGYQYVVTNPTEHKKVDGYEKWVITNRRVGTVNIKVSKTWLDGNQEASYRPSAKLTLECIEQNDAVDTTNNTVTLDGLDAQAIKSGTTAADGTVSANDEGAAAIQQVSTNNTSEYYFCNLPKYDAEGKVVHYQVKETWVDDAAKADAADKDYAVRYGENYTLGATLHTNDYQAVSVSNYRTGSTPVAINKSWNDVYQYKLGNRPDLKLTLYQREHVMGEDGNVITQISLYNGTGFKDYLWNPTNEKDTERANYDLTADFGTLPKYDSLGYEIDYFFEETVPSGAQTVYDYNETSYKYDTEEAEAPSTEEGSDTSDWLISYNGATLLKAGGTFINTINNSVKFTGTKIWENLPSGFPAEQIPSLKVYIDQYVGDKRTVEGIAETSTLQVQNGSNRVTFDIEHQGVNSSNEGAEPSTKTGELLPKYDAEGNLYTYKLRETYTNNPVDADSWSEVFERDDAVGSYTLKNIYNASETTRGSIVVTKDWKDRGAYESSKFPVVTFTLYREYKTAQDTYSGSIEKVATKTLNANNGDTKVQFDDLSKYAPNGYEYRYFVVENAIDGQEVSWRSGQELEVNGTTVKASPYVTVAGGDSMYVSATNTYVPETINLAIKKVWNDGDDAAGMRPETITVTLHRSADAQSANNGIAEEDLKVDFTLGTNGVWQTTTGAVLDKWAPNGKPWKYTVVEESVPDGYVVNTSAATVAANAANPTVTLTNTYDTKATFTKTWEDSNNKYGTRPAYLKVKLQVAKALDPISDLSTISENGDDGWKDARDASDLGESLQNYLCTQFTDSKDTCQKFISSPYTASASNLPAKAKIDGKTYYLYYRIVEDVTYQDSTAYPMGDNTQNPSDEAYYHDYTRTKNETTYNSSTKSYNNATTNKMETTSLEVTKNWSDYNNAYGIRPSSIKFKLQYSTDGQNWSEYTVGGSVVTITMSAANSTVSSDGNTWTQTFTDLPKYAVDGTEYKWRLSELAGSSSYTGSYDNDAESGSANQTTYTNSLKTFSLTFNKQGLDANGENAANLNGVSFDVYFKGQSTKLFTWTRDAAGAYSVSNVKTYKDASGADAALPISVDAATGVVSGLPAGTYILKETAAPEIYVQNKSLQFTITSTGVVSSTTANAVSGDATSGYTVTMTDPLAAANLTINKRLQDYDGGTSALEGAKFDLYRLVDGNWAKQNESDLVTNAQGQIAVENLGVGSYYLVETHATADAVLDTTHRYFSVTNTNDGQVTSYSGTTFADGDTSNGEGAYYSVDSAKNAVTITNKHFGARIKFSKVDGTDSSTITGATFELWYKDQEKADGWQLVKTLTSSNGIYTADKLEKGLYELIETKAPVGYTASGVTSVNVNKDHCVASFEIKTGSDGQTIDISKSDGSALEAGASNTIANNRIPGSLAITKLGDDGKALANTEFKLERQTDAVANTWESVATLTTDTNGQASVAGLEWGHYRLSETKPTDGYVSGTNAQGTTFDIAAKSTSITLSLTNKMSKIVVAKVTTAQDGSESALAGAQFTLSDAEGNVISSWTSDAGGAYEINSLVQGKTYTLTEAERPGGYFVLSAPVIFHVDSDGNIVLESAPAEVSLDSTNKMLIKVTNTHITADLSFTKTELVSETCADGTLNNGAADASDTKPLEGAEFTLSAEDNKTADGEDFEAQTAVSDADGKVSFENLPEGTYTLSETVTPAGHVTAADRIVEVTGEGKVLMGMSTDELAEITSDTAIVNDVNRASLSFKKVSELDHTKVLPGAEYELYRLGEAKSADDTDADSNDSDGSTDEDGNIITQLLNLFAGGDDTSTNEGILIAKATSDENGIVSFEGLLANYQYRLHESVAPAGSLASANDITIQFELQEDGTYQAVLVDDGESEFDGDTFKTAEIVDGVLTWYEPQTEILVQKLDKEGKALAGAKLQIEDEDGKVVKDASGTELSWTSTAEAHSIIGTLVAGKTYYLVETEAPEGYKLAEKVKIEVKDSAADPTQTHAQTIVMVDEPEDPVTPVSPTSPESPTSPTSPTSPEAPKSTDAEKKADKAIPQTGDTNASAGTVVVLGVVGAALIAIGLVMARRNK